MLLVDLDPQWITAGEQLGIDGITFWCPHCRLIRLGVWFRVPVVDAKHMVFQPDWIGYMSNHVGPYWDRQGVTFDKLTLKPTVDASRLGHWHGWIRDGEVVHV